MRLGLDSISNFPEELNFSMIIDVYARRRDVIFSKRYHRQILHIQQEPQSKMRDFGSLSADTFAAMNITRNYPNS